MQTESLKLQKISLHQKQSFNQQKLAMHQRG